MFIYSDSSFYYLFGDIYFAVVLPKIMRLRKISRKGFQRMGLLRRQPEIQARSGLGATLNPRYVCRCSIFAPKENAEITIVLCQVKRFQLISFIVPLRA